jgi:hypothetical protein
MINTEAICRTIVCRAGRTGLAKPFLAVHRLAIQNGNLPLKKELFAPLFGKTLKLDRESRMVSPGICHAESPLRVEDLSALRH